MTPPPSGALRCGPTTCALRTQTAAARRRRGAPAAAPRARHASSRSRRSVVAAALDAAAVSAVIEGVTGVAGAALDALLGGVPAAFAASAPGSAAAERAGLFGVDTEVLSFGLTAAVAVGLPAAFSLARDARVKRLSAADAAQLLAAGAVLVDVRSGAAQERGGPCAPRATVVPWLRLVGGLPVRNRDFADDVLFAAGSAPLLLCDSAGALSLAAARDLAQKARNDVYILEGGLDAWVAAQQPVSGDAAGALAPDVLAAEAAAAAAVGANRFAVQLPRPKLLTVLAEGYGLADLRRDVLAGLSVGVIALSLSMALGIASEATPAAGLYTAVAAGFTVSALGGSRVAIGGPTAAFIPILINVAHGYGAEGLVTCTVMAGGMLIAMGFAGVGTLITKIPRPVVTGFTAGIACFIFSTQLKDFLGLRLPPGSGPVPAQFLEKLAFLGAHLDATHLPSLGLAAGSLALLRLYPAAWARTVPPQIVAVVAGTLVVAGLEAAGIHSGIETIGSRFGADAIPSSLPVPHLALPSLDVLRELVPPAFTIALLAAIESLLCAVVADGMIDDKHDPKAELVAQGVANILSASVGGLPATGALARTAANVRSGGRSPVSGMVHALTVLVIMLAAGPLASDIPLPALSAVLVVVAINMGDWGEFAQLGGWPSGEAMVFLTAFMLTVLTDVTVAVEGGLVLAGVLSLQRVGEATDLALPSALTAARLRLRASSEPAPSGVELLELSGVLLFGTTDKLERAVERAFGSADARVLVLDCARLIALDVTGLEALTEAQHKLSKAGKTLVLAGLRQQPHTALSTSGVLDKLGDANVVRDSEDGVSRARELLV